MVHTFLRVPWGYWAILNTDSNTDIYNAKSIPPSGLMNYFQPI